MDWIATLDAVEKDKTNGNIIVTLTITNGDDVRVTERIPGNDITPEWLAGLAAARIAAYQAREDAISQLVPGPITPAPFVVDARQAAIQKLALAKQIADLKAPSDDPDVQAAQAELAALASAVDVKLP